MVHKKQRVAVIGAGVSGVASARHLLAAGVDVVGFERYRAAGGNWTYDERKPVEPQYPSIKPSVADFVTELEGETEGPKVSEDNATLDLDLEELKFAPPGPAYSGLMNNIPTGLQKMIDHPWPAGTESYVNVRVKQQYIQSYSKIFGIEPLIRYNTRVEKLHKIGSKWEVRSTTLIREGPDRGRKIRSVEEFDGVVVASGHYHAAKVPDIPGLKDWKAAWPDRVYHSKGYRNPSELKDQTVLIIGAGVSSTDIARESHHGAKKIYQSSRGGTFDTPKEWVPPNTERVVGVSSFEIPKNGQATPGNITLTDGTVLTGVDKVIIATGYLFSLPFLLDLHDDSLTPEEANETILVTDGTQIHNLHKDIFYIPDPSLAFVGIPFYTTTFTLFEYQAILVAAVFAGFAQTPSESEMRAEYDEKVKTLGCGRTFHSLKGTQVEYADSLVEWVNSQAEITGGAKVQGYSQEWIDEMKLMMVKFSKFVETRTNRLPMDNSNVLVEVK
ncbi:hypothetical protein WAI453_009246 [Rhynchosporium graminicola]|uniref:Related to FAD dependent oxidoreductase n=1 Tax=Rhynchosporium graminicola TaxID=2792576 RepID=A0A1E1KRG9_9HELO|nr:related to FAD dependent oxidoreductase [Rhynchosporium commune]